MAIACVRIHGTSKYVYYIHGTYVRSAASYSTIVLYSRDHKGAGVVHEKTITQRPVSLFPNDDEAVLVR